MSSKKSKGYLFPILFITILTGLNLYCRKVVHAEGTWESVTSLDSTVVNVLESTPYGILAGEYVNTGASPSTPFNAIYFSGDFGDTWRYLGLDKSGILDLKYYDGVIYASTFYVINNHNGLYQTKDFGETWENINPGVATTKVDRDSKTIYLGSVHYGLYVSGDEGETWQNRTELYGMGGDIKQIQSSEDITLFSNVYRVFKTTDNGETWSEITQLYGKGIASFCINGNIIFAGSSGTGGLYLSKDLGQTWQWVSSFGSYTVGKIFYFDGKYYAGRVSPEKHTMTVYYTGDLGLSWVDTNLDYDYYDRVTSMTALYSEPSYLFSTILHKGVLKYTIPKQTFARNPFLNIPWEYENENELVDNITSYFDHSYPLLGYSYFYEPEEESNTTLNFLGYKNTQPYIYYSSHSGTDFGLKYGTPILAPASGYATYYYCKDCGNSIKIDHQNGLQTTYMHLQEEDLITKNEQIWVNNNDIIGKVGLTGRTTGPHLHFEVTSDVSNDGSFSNDFPSGRTDPFGWQKLEKEDPWGKFTWEDSLGNHTGSKSFYLWNVDNKSNTKNIISDSDPNTDNKIVLENKEVDFGNTQKSFTAKMFSYAQPILESFDFIKSYVRNTSFVIEAFDQIGRNILNFDLPINMTLNLDSDDLVNINKASVGLYYWNEVSKAWDYVPSYFDQVSNKLTTIVNHLSWFAVFGDKTDQQPPATTVSIVGNLVDGWFSEPPLATFFFDEEDSTDLESTFYSVNNGDTWEKYTEPFYTSINGITELIYKSQDLSGNIEKENTQVLHINLNGSKTDKTRVVGASFETVQ